MWIVNHDSNSDEMFAQESTSKLPIDIALTKKEISKQDVVAQRHSQKNDSVPIYLTLKMALDGFVKSSKFSKTNITKNDLFELKRATGNNYSLDYFIDHYFDNEMNLGDGEVISSVSGDSRLITTVQNEDKLDGANIIHRVYGEDYGLIVDFKLKAIGFESAESVTVCSGDKVFVDNVSGLSNGRSIFVYNPEGKSIKELTIDEGLHGTAVACINDQLYIVAKSDHKNSTFVFKIKGEEIVKVLEIENFESNSSVARLENENFLLLSEINTKEVKLINLTLNELTTLSVVGDASIYRSHSGFVVVGEDGRESSVSLIDIAGAETSNYSFKGIFMGFIEEPLSKSNNLIFFDKYNKSINVHKLHDGEEEEEKYAFSKYNNFDELVFLWNGIVVDIKTAFGL